MEVSGVTVLGIPPKAPEVNVIPVGANAGAVMVTGSPADDVPIIRGLAV
jgi:hypothetical protein